MLCRGLQSHARWFDSIPRLQLRRREWYGKHFLFHRRQRRRVAGDAHERGAWGGIAARRPNENRRGRQASRCVCGMGVARLHQQHAIRHACGNGCASRHTAAARADGSGVRSANPNQEVTAVVGARSGRASCNFLLVVLLLFNRGGIRHPLPYAIVGLLLWYALHVSGIHATLAGILLAFFIPARPAFAGHNAPENSRAAVERLGSLSQSSPTGDTSGLGAAVSS